jgi:hypothetical protein
MTVSPSLTRLVYVSQATFKPFHTPEGMECHVAEILAVSRRNNQQQNLVGALYYGSGNFFQCLEGEKTAVEALYNKLQHDSRHHRLKILHQAPIDTLGFPEWDMKYTMIDQQARDFIKQHGFRKFDPYQFTPDMVQQFIRIMLLNSQDVPAPVLQQAIDTPMPAIQPLARMNYLLIVALSIILVFAVISLSTL